MIITYIFSSLNRYITRVFLGSFGLTLLTISLVIALFDGLELVRKSMAKTNITLALILEMVGLKLPQMIQLLLPFVVMIAAILTLWRLHSRHELMAIRSFGRSIWNIIGGLMASIFVLGIFNLSVLNPLTSALTARLLTLEASYFNRGQFQLAISDAGIWLRETAEGRQSILRSKVMNPRSGELSEVTFYNFNDQGEFKDRYEAQNVRLEKGKWMLEKVTVWPSGEKRDYMPLPTHLNVKTLQASHASPSTISFWALPNYIQKLESSGLSSTAYRLHWHGEISKIFLMMSMTILAAAFTRRPLRQGGAIRIIGFGLLCGFILHFMNDVVLALGVVGKLPIIVAAWALTAITTFCSATYLLHAEDG